MAKKLTAAFVKTVTGPGKYGDQHGLILRVLPSGSKQWIWRGTVHGRRRDLGLGGFPYVSLAEARQLAFDYRKLARAGGDPSALRKGRAVPTFEQALEEVLAIHRGSWRDGGKSEQQWRASLRDYAIPQLGRRPVDAITTADVIAVLTPIWNEKRVTAQRVRQRIGAIMRWAIAQGYRGDNPAGEALAAVLPRNGVARQHQRALPHGEVAAALGQGARVRGVAGDEARVRVSGVERVPLGRGAGRPLGRDRLRGRDLDSAGLADEGRARAAGAAIRAGAWGAGWGAGARRRLRAGVRLADRPGADQQHVERAVPRQRHRVRAARVPVSSFRDWAAEQTDTPHAVMEAALAHAVRDKAEAAYARSDLFEKRRKLMEQWAGYLAQGRSEVPAVVPRHG